MTMTQRTLLGLTLVVALSACAGSAPAKEPQGTASPKGRTPDAEARIEKIQNAVRVVQDRIRETAQVAVGGENNPSVKKLRKQLAELEAELKAERARAAAELRALRARHLKVFRLKRASPDELQQALLVLLDSWPEVADTMPGSAPGGTGIGNRGGMRPGGPALPGAAPIGGIDSVGFPPWFGQDWRTAVDERTGSIIIRGSAKDLQIASDFVALADSPPDKPLPRVRSLQAFKLKFADAGVLAQILSQLSIGDIQAVSLRERLLVVRGPADALREVSQLVEDLDVEVKPPPGKGGAQPGK